LSFDAATAMPAVYQMGACFGISGFTQWPLMPMIAI
jgi:hypothetical protein